MFIWNSAMSFHIPYSTYLADSAQIFLAGKKNKKLCGP